MKHLMMYKEEAGEVKIEVVELDSPSLLEIREKGRQALEGKSVEWAFLPAGDWIIRPE